MTTSIRASRSARSPIAETISGGRAARSTSRSSVVDCGSGAGRTSSASSADSMGSGATSDLQVADGGGDESRLGDANECLLQEQRHGCDLGEARLLETSV